MSEIGKWLLAPLPANFGSVTGLELGKYVALRIHQSDEELYHYLEAGAFADISFTPSNSFILAAPSLFPLWG